MLGGAMLACDCIEHACHAASLPRHLLYCYMSADVAVGWGVQVHVRGWWVSLARIPTVGQVGGPATAREVSGPGDRYC